MSEGCNNKVHKRPKPINFCKLRVCECVNKDMGLPCDLLGILSDKDRNKCVREIKVGPCNNS